MQANVDFSKRTSSDYFTYFVKGNLSFGCFIVVLKSPFDLLGYLKDFIRPRCKIFIVSIFVRRTKFWDIVLSCVNLRELAVLKDLTIFYYRHKAFLFLIQHLGLGSHDVVEPSVIFLVLKQFGWWTT